MDNNIKMMDKLKRRWTTTGAPSATIPELSAGGRIIPLVLIFCISAAENMLALMVKELKICFWITARIRESEPVRMVEA